MVSNVPNIHIGIYKNYQNFHPLMFYGYTRLRGVGVDLPHPGWNMVNSKGQLLHGWFWLSPWAWEGSMRWRRRRRRWILERCRQSLMVITSLRLNCDDEIHRSESLHNVLLFTHNVIHTNQTFQLIVLAWSESPNQSFMFRSFCTVKWPENDPNSNWTEIGHKREMWNETQYLRSVCTTKRVTQFWYRSLK